MKVDDERSLIEDILTSDSVKDFCSKVEKAVEKGMRKGIEKGVEKGVEKGIVKGMEKSLEKALESKAFEEKLKIAKNLIVSGLDDSFICNCTGLSMNDIIKMKDRI